MNSKPFISIGIASYNYEKLIIRELNSIKRQKFTDYEVVICDDCSTDNSVMVIEQYIKSNPQMNIRLIKHLKNMGILQTKNDLLHNSIGEYIMICDSDDWMADNCLEVLAKVAIQEDADRVIAEVYDIDGNGKVLQIQDLPKKPSKWLSTLHHGSIYRRKIFIENNITFKCMPDDAYIILKFNQYCNKVSFIREPIYYWYVHNDSEGRGKKKIQSVEWAVNYFKNILSFVNDTQAFIGEKSTNMITNEDIEMVRLLLLKLYYNHILHGLRNMNLYNTLQTYYRLKKIMYNNDMKYLNNRYLKKKEDSPLRCYAYRIIRLCTIIEKLHLMSIGITIYKLLSKFIYFDQ